MSTVDVDAPEPKPAQTTASWAVTLYGIADSPEEARDIARAIVEKATSYGLRSGTASAPGLRADLTPAGIVPRPIPPDPTSAEAVQGVPHVKNTPLGADGLPDPAREAKTAKASAEPSAAGKSGKS